MQLNLIHLDYYHGFSLVWQEIYEIYQDTGKYEQPAICLQSLQSCYGLHKDKYPDHLNGEIAIIIK